MQPPGRGWYFAVAVRGTAFPLEQFHSDKAQSISVLTLVSPLLTEQLISPCVLSLYIPY